MQLILVKGVIAIVTIKANDRIIFPLKKSMFFGRLGLAPNQGKAS
jgi:hypothetical protein